MFHNSEPPSLLQKAKFYDLILIIIICLFLAKGLLGTAPAETQKTAPSVYVGHDVLQGLVTDVPPTLEHIPIIPPLPLFTPQGPTPRLVVRCVKWGDKVIKGYVTNPFGVPHPRTLATRTRRQRSCVLQFTNIRDVSEPGSIDPACLQVYSSHLHPHLPNGYIQYKTSRQHLFLPQAEKVLCWCAPATPTCHAPSAGFLLLAFRLE